MKHDIEIDVRDDVEKKNEITFKYIFADYGDCGQYGHLFDNCKWVCVHIVGLQGHIARVRREDIPALIKALERTSA